MDRKGILARIQSHHREALKYRRGALKDERDGQKRASLRRWQAKRLEETYADLLEERRYRAAATFFLSDLYGTGDLATRDDQLERVLPTMVRLAPPQALEPLALAVEVDALSERLDSALGAVLFADEATPAPITVPRYAAAYRACANRDERIRQIEMIVGVGKRLDQLARVPMLSVTVRMMRGVANTAGFGELQSFLERGLAAFHQMRGADQFLGTIQARELQINDRLFDSAPRPFAID